MEFIVEEFVEEYLEETPINISKRHRSKNREWFKKLQFNNREEAESHIETEGIWRKCSTKKTLEGDKTEYRCAKGKYRNNECPARIYLLFHSTSEAVSLYSTECEHSNHTTSNRGLDEQTKVVVTELFLNGIEKPNAILSTLRNRGLSEPPKIKLIAFIRQLRTNKYGLATISGFELKNWCKAHKNVPECSDIPFVLDYQIKCGSLNESDQGLIIVVSTVRLLKQLELSEILQIDTTYKLIWQGYPVILIGTSDKNKTFHPFAIAICNKESEDEFNFIFSALHKYNLPWKPKILLADESTAITIGFIKTFGPPKVRLMSFSHVLQDAEKKLKGLEAAATIKKDIKSLQTCSNQTIFEKASILFIEKWNDTEFQEFTDNFQQLWLQTNQNWYEGAASGYPSTNNGIEATNAETKKEHTFRDRLPAEQFLNNLNDLLMKWSMNRNSELPNYKMFAEKPTIALNEWIESYHWALQNKNILNIEDKYYVCSSNSSYESITSELLSQYLGESWKSFEDFEQSYYGIWCFSIDPDINKCKCTCPYFLKNYKCKHTLGLLIRLKKVEVPSEVKNIPSGQKRKRGRPSQTKKALIL